MSETAELDLLPAQDTATGIAEAATAAASASAAAAAGGEPPREVADEVVESLTDVAEIRDGSAIVKLSATEAGLAALRKDLAGKVYDLKTVKGNAEARSDRKRCVTLRTTLERRRKELKAPAVEFGRLIDAEAKRITEEVLKLEGPIDTAIVADEQRRETERQERERREAERVAGLRAKVATINGYITQAQAPGMTAERIAGGIERLKLMAFTEAQWQEFAAEASAARDNAVTQLTTLHAGAVEREAEAARLARQREELAEQERQLAAARAEQDRKDAAERAERERVARHTAAIENMAALPAQLAAATSTYITAFIAKFEAEDASEARFEEFAGRAAEVKAAALASLRDLAETAAADERAEQDARNLEAARRGEISAIEHQVLIAEVGRAGVREGGTLACIRETLAETEAWPVTEEVFGPLLSLATATRDGVVTRLRTMLQQAEQRQAEKEAADRAKQETQPPAAVEAAADAAPVAVREAENPAQPREAALLIRPVPTLSDKAVADANARAFMERLERKAEEPASLKLGDINARIAPLKLDAAGMAALGITPAKTEGAAKLYRESDFSRLLSAIAVHVRELQSVPF